MLAIKNFTKKYEGSGWWFYFPVLILGNIYMWLFVVSHPIYHAANMSLSIRVGLSVLCGITSITFIVWFIHKWNKEIMPLKNKITKINYNRRRRK